MYYATGGTHAPHHVPTEWADKYQGAFDQGWDALREQTFARASKDMGVVPDNAELTERPDEIPAWDGTCRKSAASADAADGELRGLSWSRPTITSGGWSQALDDRRPCSTTPLVVYIVGDNGASGEGTLNGSFNEDDRA